MSFLYPHYIPESRVGWRASLHGKQRRERKGKKIIRAPLVPQLTARCPTHVMTKVGCLPWHLRVWVHPRAKHPNKRDPLQPSPLCTIASACSSHTRVALNFSRTNDLSLKRSTHFSHQINFFTTLFHRPISPPNFTTLHLPISPPFTALHSCVHSTSSCSFITSSTPYCYF